MWFKVGQVGKVHICCPHTRVVEYEKLHSSLLCVFA